MEREEELYQKLLSLKEEYALVQTGRKNILNEMLDCIKKIRGCTNKYKVELHQIENTYKLRNYYISDYKLVMNTILKLANREEEAYGMKRIQTQNVLLYNANGQSYTKYVHGNAIVIASNEVLSGINEKTTFYYDEFSYMASKIINGGNSMIIVAPNYFNGDVKPKEEIKNIEKIELLNGGFIGNISCYLQDDELRKAVMDLKNYIEVNGPDFEGVNEDMLFELIQGNNKEKVMIKK